MVKALATYFFSFLLLFLSGYGLLFGNSAGNQEAFFEVHAPGHANQDDFLLIHNQHSSIRQLQTTYHNTIEFEVTDISEEELLSSKKYLSMSSFFNALFCALLFGYFFHFLKKQLHLSRNHSCTTTPRWYILFRVIRI